jgi:hypothetical protein
LAHAFELLLGRPLDEFDPKATYALYHWDDILSFEFLDHVEDAASLATVIPPMTEFADEYVLAWGRWSLDLGRSLFMLDGGDTLGEAAASALSAVSRDESTLVVTGADLAPHLAGRDSLPHDLFVTLLARVASVARADAPGTLFDAMRAATWTMGGPDELFTDYEDVKFEPEWERALEQVQHADLRRHLNYLCLDAHSARAEGGYYSGSARCPGILSWLEEQPGFEFVTGWEFGEGQAASAVFAISADAPDAADVPIAADVPDPAGTTDPAGIPGPAGIVDPAHT